MHCRVIYSVFLMHRRTDLWGPDGELGLVKPVVMTLIRIFLALEFDPERFLDERAAKYLLKNPFIFTPFNAGPRICLGQQVSFSSCCRRGVFCIEWCSLLIMKYRFSLSAFFNDSRRSVWLWMHKHQIHCPQYTGWERRGLRGVIGYIQGYI